MKLKIRKSAAKHQKKTGFRTRQQTRGGRKVNARQRRVSSTNSSRRRGRGRTIDTRPREGSRTSAKPSRTVMRVPTASNSIPTPR